MQIKERGLERLEKKDLERTLSREVEERGGGESKQSEDPTVHRQRGEHFGSNEDHEGAGQ